MGVDSRDSKKLKFVVGNDEPTEAYLKGTESRNGIKIVGTERIQKKKKNSTVPKGKQITLGYAIGDDTHMCLVDKQWGQGLTATVRSEQKDGRIFFRYPPRLYSSFAKRAG